jgi:hypothetical protein
MLFDDVRYALILCEHSDDDWRFVRIMIQVPKSNVANEMLKALCGDRLLSDYGSVVV